MCHRATRERPQAPPPVGEIANSALEYPSSMRLILAAFVTALVAFPGGEANALFAWSSRAATGTTQPHRTAAFDRDGRPDHISVAPGGLQAGISSRYRSVVLVGVRWVTRVAEVDLDGDGDHDLVAFTWRGTLHLWRNEGAGRFSKIRARREPAAPLQGLTRAGRPSADRTAAQNRAPVIVAFHATAAVSVRAGPLLPVNPLTLSVQLDPARPPRGPPSRFA